MLKQYIVDAFTDRVFSGNPAAVAVLDSFPSDDLMLSLARENNLSETAFAVKDGDRYLLRWFTPGGEVDFCGHATLASAFVIMTIAEPGRENLTFRTMEKGDFVITRNGDMFSMDLPAYELRPVPVTDAMAEAIGVRPVEAYMARDLVCVMENAEKIPLLSPDTEKMKGLEGLLLHVTGRGEGFDCISRSFAPKLSIYEDPVCGSGHCHIVPYWSRKLGRSDITAFQASPRGGVLYCEDRGPRITMSGKAVLFAESTVFIDL